MNENLLPIVEYHLVEKFLDQNFVPSSQRAVFNKVSVRCANLLNKFLIYIMFADDLRGTNALLAKSTIET